ncbi:methyltransferase [Ekhidna sp.]
MQTNTIKSTKESSELVRDFFDDHAPAYRSKYQLNDKFYNYFFFERLDKATHGLDFTNKSILDIGAGTGPLYDYLQDKNWTDFKSYSATDISSGMLQSSNIPEKDRFVGDFTSMKFDEKFDMVFMLGVSTYLTEMQMKSHIEKVSDLLSDNGIFIVTFTNDHSIDILIRKILTPIFKLFSGKERIISQDFSTRYYSRKEIEKLFKDRLSINSIEGLNHTVFPISRLFKSFSISIAKKISSLRERKFKFLFSSDLLIKVSK